MSYIKFRNKNISIFCFYFELSDCVRDDVSNARCAPLAAQPSPLPTPHRRFCARLLSTKLNDDKVASILGPEPLERDADLPALTKIVATVGPASDLEDMVQQLVQNGMHVMRINFSHATYGEAEERIKHLKKARGRHISALGTANPNMRAVLLDTQGPEVRTGILKGDKVKLESGQEVTITADEDAKGASTPENLFVNYSSLASSVSVGSQILLDDGLISLSVTHVDASERRVVCTCDNGALLGSRKGVTLPGVTLDDLPSITDKDKSDISWACATASIISR